MEELTELFGAAASAIESAGGDCAAMAAGIHRVAHAHGELLERLGRLDDPDVERRSHIWMDAHGETLSANATRMHRGSEPCHDHRGVQAAMDRITTRRRAASP